MKYLIYKDNQTHVYLEKRTIVCNVVPQTFIKELCLSRLFSYDGMVQAIKQKLNIKTNVPIYLSYELIVFPITCPRYKETIWLNYKKIYRYLKEDYQTKVIFWDKTSIRLNVSYKTIEKKLRECEKIINHMATEKMSVYNMWLITFSSKHIWKKTRFNDIINTINTIINLLEELYGQEND